MSERSLWGGRRMHFVGVGGAGMSGYARAAHALGASVSGSDRADSPYLRVLREEGVLDAAIGHVAANIPAGDDVELVYSSAVPVENPERVAARERGLRERSRAELLGELTALRRTIAVAGAHGKTTTASMIVWLLRAAGRDPGWLIGSAVGDGLPNSHWSSGEWLVVEADESDRSMLSLSVSVAVLTNVELDHHAAFGSLAELRADYARFLALAREAIVVWDRPDLLALVPNRHAAIAYDVSRPSLFPGGSAFQWHGREVRLSVPGAHNALNAAAALEAARLAGAELEAAEEGRAEDEGAEDEGAEEAGAEEDGAGLPGMAQGAIQALRTFGGAARRFQRLGQTSTGALVVDDYAHHPTEVAATIAAARSLEHERLVAVFQPHLYSRTAALATDFGAALAQADVAVVLDVYPARERAEDHPGISGLTVVRAAAERSDSKSVYWLRTLDEAARVLPTLLGTGDVCLVMGAGDVDRLARALLDDSRPGARA